MCCYLCGLSFCLLRRGTDSFAVFRGKSVMSEWEEKRLRICCCELRYIQHTCRFGWSQWMILTRDGMRMWHVLVKILAILITIYKVWCLFVCFCTWEKNGKVKERDFFGKLHQGLFKFVKFYYLVLLITKQWCGRRIKSKIFTNLNDFLWSK